MGFKKHFVSIFFGNFLDLYSTHASDYNARQCSSKIVETDTASLEFLRKFLRFTPHTFVLTVMCPLQVRRRGGRGSRGSNESPLQANDEGLKTQNVIVEEWKTNFECLSSV